jgi:hypothetical protein
MLAQPRAYIESPERFESVIIRRTAKIEADDALMCAERELIFIKIEIDSYDYSPVASRPLHDRIIWHLPLQSSDLACVHR